MYKKESSNVVDEQETEVKSLGGGETVDRANADRGRERDRVQSKWSIERDRERELGWGFVSTFIKNKPNSIRNE